MNAEDWTSISNFGWCEGHIPVGNEWIDAKWVRNGEEVTYSLCVPNSFTAHVIE